MSSYTVEEVCGCTIIYGSVPIMQMVNLMQRYEDGVMDTSLATVLGANMVIGPPAALKALRNEPGIMHAVDEKVSQHTNGYDLSEQAQQWLKQGYRGKSSEAMFARFSGVKSITDDPAAFPHDPSDLARCRLLLESVPEFANKLYLMRSVSPIWNALVDHWEALCATMDQEAPNWRDGHGSSPETYRMMNDLIDNH